MDNAKNFAKVTVSTGYDAAATSIVLVSGDGAKLPTPPFNVVWWNYTDYPDPSDDPNKEIVRVTAISTDTLTVTRAQEGTSASTKNTSGKTYKMIAGITAKVINTDIVDFRSFTAGEKLYANHCVYVSSANGNVYNANATSTTVYNYIGFVSANANAGDTVNVDIVKTVSGFSGLTPGAIYYAQDSTQVIDQQNTGGIDNDSSALIGQSFTVGTGVTHISKVSLNLQNGSGSDWTVVMNIRSGENIAGTIIATKTVVIPRGNGNVYVDFDFSSNPIPVTAGNQYTLEISNQGTFTKWNATSTSAYAGGRAYWQGSWSDIVDRNFKTYYWSLLPGSIGTSAGTYSQKVGKALSATDLLIIPN
jgi:hypothetical protein